jgi:hypothetical protein
MRLADRIAQCRAPFIVQDLSDRTLTHLNGAADFAPDMLRCPIRYVLSDELVRLCAALAYSKGARHLDCADLLHVPARSVWVEWCEAAWETELRLYGFKAATANVGAAGRRGALVQALPNGRRGTIRTFWSDGGTDSDVLASSMEAYFDLDTDEGDAPAAPDGEDRRVWGVYDGAEADADILRRCFRFRFERTWAEYYGRARLSIGQEEAIARHALGTIAADIPVLLAFFLLLSTRTGLPRRSPPLERLNRSRVRAHKAPLLDHVEVLCPVMQEYHPAGGGAHAAGRRAPRLHHVRGHLMRRGSQLYWRVPHLRGSARAGVVHTRTVTWTVDRPAASQSPG